jgi:hypothetical protein
MWKQAFMKVKAVNRLMRAATLNRPENVANRTSRKRSTLTKALSRKKEISFSA